MSTEFQQKVQLYSMGGFVSLAAGLGNQLGLFKALSDVSSEDKPATAAQVAEKAHCKERYVMEWLACMACADFIEVNEEEKFWIDAEKKKVLIDQPMTSLVHMTHISIFGRSVEKLKEAFKADHPRLGLDYADYSDFYHVMEQLTEAMHGQFLIPKLLPDIGSNVVEGLEKGFRCLDVGCGNGFHSHLLAKHFPNSNFTGLDISEGAIATGIANRDKADLTNLDFIVCNSKSMPEEWSNSFDFVTIFDACHDQMRPDLCCKEIFRVLKPGGIFAMVEVRGTSNVYKDKQADPAASAILYSASLHHCLPVSSNSPDALCMGAKWGTRRAHKLLSDAGFENIEIKNLEYTLMNCLYICKK